MSTDPPFPSPAALRVRALEEALRVIFGDTPEGRAARRRCSDALGEIEAFADRRGLRGTGIAVIGSKNSGKSWLCRQLVLDEAARRRIPSGEETAESTAKATWIGPDAPPVPDPRHEARIPVPREQMADLGRAYTLLDLPGYDDAGVDEREAALRAVRGVEFRVIVISGATKQIESQFSYLAESDGVRILPVIVDGNWPVLKTTAAGEVAAVVDRIRRHCPQAEVEEPVVIPHVDHAPGDPAAHLETARAALLPALRAFLDRDPLDGDIIGRVALERLRRELARDLRGFRERVAPAHAGLEAREAELAGELIRRILGEDAQLAAGLRMRMRFHTLAETPAWFFPFRAFLGLFALTAGAWDRLAFAMAGSLPSLALLAAQTARNAKRLGEASDHARHALAERVERMARDELADHNRVFVRAIHACRTGGGPADETTDAPPARIEGFESVTEGSAEIFAAAVRRHARPRGLPRLLGLLATLLFLALLAAPAAAIYQEFIGAWIDLFGGGRLVRWPDFPAPSPGMIFATLLLVVLPAIALALVASVSATPARRVAAALAEIKREHLALLDRLTRERALRLASDDPVREAARKILGFLAGG